MITNVKPSQVALTLEGDAEAVAADLGDYITEELGETQEAYSGEPVFGLCESPIRFSADVTRAQWIPRAIRRFEAVNADGSKGIRDLDVYVEEMRWVGGRCIVTILVEE